MSSHHKLEKGYHVITEPVTTEPTDWEQLNKNVLEVMAKQKRIKPPSVSKEGMVAKKVYQEKRRKKNKVSLKSRKKNRRK